MSREQARTLAQQEVRQRFGLDPAALREVSADEQERPARADWQFTWTPIRASTSARAARRA